MIPRPSDRVFTVLAIDGGGVRGVIPGIVVRELERLAQARGISHAVQLFDLVVGTSTGGNMALGLTCPGDDSAGYRYDAAGVLAVYEAPANSRRIFTPYLPFVPSTGGRPLSPLWGLLTPRYSGRGVTEEMQRQFGPARLSQVRTPVSCVSYDIANARPHVFRSVEAGTPGRDHLLCDVARATSAAPLFFPPVRLGRDAAANNSVFVDGGVCLPDPAILAFIEACAMLRKLGGDISEHRICVLSIGTGGSHQTFDPRWGGLWGWMRGGHLLDLLADSGAEVADIEGSMLSSPRGGNMVHRIQVPLVGPGYACASAMDDWTTENLRQLTAAGSAAVAEHAALLARIVEIGVARTTG